MKKIRTNGSLILFSSIYGMRGQDMSIYKNTEIKENIVYAVSKGGISNFVREAASYYGKYRIRVNAICQEAYLVILKDLKIHKAKYLKKFI